MRVVRVRVVRTTFVGYNNTEAREIVDFGLGRPPPCEICAFSRGGKGVFFANELGPPDFGRLFSSTKAITVGSIIGGKGGW